MNHLLNICNINGAEVESVDVVIGGSPCQDLSVGGKRAGLDGERSGLFMEQVRIVKEMRDEDARNGRAIDAVRPRYMVWENVPGAFSSNKGEDFRVVLEETAKIADETAIIPRPDKGKWTNAGAIMGDGWSIAWRVFDAQFWGVPQRRRRIALVADFGGQSAPEILFESDSVSRDITEGGETGQRIAADAERSSGAAGESCVKSAGFIGANGVKAHGIGYEEEKSPTVVAGRTNDVVIESYGFEPGIAKREGNPNRFSEDLCPTLRAKMGDNQAAVAYSLQGNMIGRADHNGPQGSGVNEDVSFTLNTVDRHAVCYGLVSKGNGEAFLMEEKHMSLSCGGGQAGQGYPAILERRTDDAVCYGFAPRQQSMTITEDCANPILSTDYKDPQTVCYGIGSYHSGGIPVLNDQGGSVMGVSYGVTGTLRAEAHGHQPIVVQDLYENHGTDSRVTGPHEVCPTVTRRWGTGGNNTPLVHTYSTQSYSEVKESEQGASLKASGGTYGGGSENYVVQKYIVRRLTPLECERLQGFPDNWTNIPPQTEVTAEDLSFWRTVWNEWQEMNGAKPKTDKQIIKWLQSEPADSARYKALGNSIALPPWRFVLSRIHNQGARTMASLFDGIGGFPKIWQELGGQTLWCSEVEPFPIAVTRYYFKEVIK
jgi:DNA (cytosine-5)-methyltransferase 1